MKRAVSAITLLIGLWAANAPAATPTTRVVGRAVHASQGDILLERAIDPARSMDYERLGFRRVGSMGQVADKTIFRDHIYILYPVDTEYTAFRPDKIEGQSVTLEIVHDVTGYPYVVHVALGVKP